MYYMVFRLISELELNLQYFEVFQSVVRVESSCNYLNANCKITYIKIILKFLVLSNVSTIETILTFESRIDHTPDDHVTC